MEYNSNAWDGASTAILWLLDHRQERPYQLVNDGSVFNSIDSLEHRYNVPYVSLLATTKGFSRSK